VRDLKLLLDFMRNVQVESTEFKNNILKSISSLNSKMCFRDLEESSVRNVVAQVIKE